MGAVLLELPRRRRSARRTGVPPQARCLPSPQPYPYPCTQHVTRSLTCRSEVARARQGKSKAKQARRERVAAARRKQVAATKPAKSSGKQSKKRKGDSDGSGPNGSGTKRSRGA